MIIQRFFSNFVYDGILMPYVTSSSLDTPSPCDGFPVNPLGEGSRRRQKISTQTLQWHTWILDILAEIAPMIIIAAEDEESKKQKGMNRVGLEPTPLS